MSPNFLKAVNKVLEHEGGYVNHPADRGGPTNWGITMKVYADFMNGPVAISEMKTMPKANAIAIYKRNYWDVVKGDLIKSYAKAFMIFDQAVNRGPRSSIKQAQRVSGATVDGVLGPKSLEAINKKNEKSFIDSFIIESREFYNSLVARKPSQSVFLKGWMNRVNSLEEYAYKNRSTIGIFVAALIAIGGTIVVINRKA